jgi:hypothetical protein
VILSSVLLVVFLASVFFILEYQERKVRKECKASFDRIEGILDRQIEEMWSARDKTQVLTEHNCLQYETDDFKCAKCGRETRWT